MGGTAGSKNSVVAGLDATDSSVVVDLGYGADTVSVASSAALTLKVGREDGADNSLGSALDGNDTLVLTTGKISDVLMDNTDKTMLKFGATSVKGAFVTTAGSEVGGFNVQFGSDEAKKLAYSTDDSKAIAYSKDVSYYLGAKDGKVSVSDANTDDVVLDMVNFTNGITSVGLTKANTANNKVAVDIVAKADTTIDAGVDHADAEWKFDLTANEDKKVNLLDLGTDKKGVDRITLSDAKGNQDSVKGFVAGEDILHLSDVAKLTEKTFTVDTNGVVLNNSQASINGAISATANLDVVLADGTAKKVALAATGLVEATQKTTTVINQTAAAAKVDFNITEATENNAAFVVDMTGTVSNAIDYLGQFSTIAATVAAADALIIGNDATTSIGYMAVLTTVL